MIKIAEDWNHIDAIRESDFIFDSGTSANMILVNSIHALNQLVGYLKYLNRENSRIYFRGQTKSFKTLTANIFRNSKSSSSIGVRNNSIVTYIKGCSKIMTIVDQLPEYVKEPLLQHYGVKTRWIDLVDNLWIAIWFGLHEYNSKFLEKQYEFVYQRKDEDDYLYIQLLGNDALVQKDGCPGLYTGISTQVIDLRIAAPSTFLRPHCQHALLMKSKINDTLNDVDLSKYVVLIIKIKVKDGIDWIGNGRLITGENIYPSPLYDQGYGIMLEQAPHTKNHAKTFGSIKNISYAVPNCY